MGIKHGTSRTSYYYFVNLSGTSHLNLVTFYKCPKCTQETLHRIETTENKITLGAVVYRREEGKKMDIRLMELDSPLFSTLNRIMDLTEDAEKNLSAPTRTYVRDAKAMAATSADVKEYPNSYVFVIDMPGLKSGDIKVQVEEDNVLIISGERKREEEKEGAKYLRMERRVGKFMRKFTLPDNANTDAISAICQDGVLTVTINKLPPPEPKKPKTIEVKIG
ncbi:hypothetical protein V8G54_008509 [Vigna mungo]|uniref:SHSP domain-containing protein n=1 Tax=Vigna mungo TaxID=3915 RepID=A0AAQ3P5V7_VIGMU